MKGYESISQISDVGCLLTLLRVVKKGNDLGAKRAVIERLMEIGVLREPAQGEDVTYANLREQVNTAIPAAERKVTSPVGK